MKGTVERGGAAGREYFVYLPPGYGTSEQEYPVVYLNEGLSFAGEVLPEVITPLEAVFRREGGGFLIAASGPREDEDTPWAAPAISAKSNPFLGGADGYLRFLTGEFKPLIDREYRTLPDPGHTCIAGYSLGGLLALYALYRADCFGRIACMSGSLWFEGFTEFMRTHEPMPAQPRCYLSLGRAERKVHNAVIATVAERTEEALGLLREQLGTERVEFAWHDGGHFTEIPARIRAGLTWAMKNW